MPVELQPELWVRDTAAAVAYYQQAFGARVEHRAGAIADPDGVLQLSIHGARFWVSGCAPSMGRLDPAALAGATARFLLVVEDPREVVRSAVDAGGRAASAVAEEHGWLVGRVVDPFGHEWEIGRPMGEWPTGGWTAAAHRPAEDVTVRARTGAEAAGTAVSAESTIAARGADRR
jgi:PhnB protein